MTRFEQGNGRIPYRARFTMKDGKTDCWMKTTPDGTTQIIDEYRMVRATIDNGREVALPARLHELGKYTLVDPAEFVAYVEAQGGAISLGNYDVLLTRDAAHRVREHFEHKIRLKPHRPGKKPYATK